MTRLNLTKLVICLGLAMHCGSAIAHPGGHGPSDDSSVDSKSSRTWTLAQVGAHLHGSFVSARDGKVQIRCDDGSLRSLVIDQLSELDQRWIATRQTEIQAINTRPQATLVALQKQTKSAPAAAAVPGDAPAIVQHFKPYQDTLKLRWDRDFFYVESNGMPDHPMMIGITAWQQQVPLPQPYTGTNAWRIPLHPVPAKQPLSAKTGFFRGAIALAVNGVPIFNPIKNDGRTDTLLAGELDEYGGHCGRADDYHYHIAPVHLEKVIGKGQPLAYALDGYPIYGYEESDGDKVVGLDWLNGHKDAAGNYHYHATKKYPYLNGGFYGEVVEREGQVDPQPRAGGVRPALTPLRSAKITDFKSTTEDSYRLTYLINGKPGTVSYMLADDGSAKFVFVDPSGKTTTETYSPRRRGPGGNDRPPPPRPGDNPPPRDGQRPPPPPRGQPRPPRNEEQSSNAPRREDLPTPHAALPQLAVTSSSVNDKGFISIDCTCDGASKSPAVQWQDAPQGTKCFAVSVWHIAPDQEKSYWVVYNIPANVSELKENMKDVGKVGINDKRRAEYDPMCSKGPGVKKYHITVFALSAEPILAPDKATRANLLAAIKDITLSRRDVGLSIRAQAVGPSRFFLG